MEERKSPKLRKELGNWKRGKGAALLERQVRSVYQEFQEKDRGLIKERAGASTQSITIKGLLTGSLWTCVLPDILTGWCPRVFETYGRNDSDFEILRLILHR
jgi:hypothetical protein